MNDKKKSEFSPGDLVRVPFGDCFIDAYVVKKLGPSIWVRGSDEFPESEGIYTFYPPEAIKHSDEPKGPMLRYIPNAS